MAKRFKLNNEKEAVLERALHVQELLAIPEAGKIQKLDDEMSAILQQKSLPVDKKVRLFEEKLAQFRQVQQKIIKQGGIHLVEAQEETPQMKEILESMVQQAVIQHLQQQAQASVFETPKYIPPSAGRKRIIADSMPIDEPDPIQDTPTKQQSTNRKQQMDSAMKTEGMYANDGKVFFNSGRNKYSQVTYDDVITYLTSSKESKIPYNGRKLVKIVYENMRKNGPTFASMLEKCPNLKAMHIADDVSFDKWECF
jgi:hypothetical protein